MEDEKRGVPSLTSQLVMPIALVVIVGLAQITFAFRVLTEGGSTNWFLAIMVVGMSLNMGIIVFTAISTIRGAQSRLP